MKKFINNLFFFGIILYSFQLSESSCFGEISKPTTTFFYRSIDSLERLSPSDLEHFIEEMRGYKENAENLLDSIYQDLISLNDKQERNLAVELFSTCMNFSELGLTKSECVNILSRILDEYGIPYTEEPVFIDEKLMWCGYHFYIYELYENILQNQISI